MRSSAVLQRNNLDILVIPAGGILPKADAVVTTKAEFRRFRSQPVYHQSGMRSSAKSKADLSGLRRAGCRGQHFFPNGVSNANA